MNCLIFPVDKVFSTYVEMILMEVATRWVAASILHVCGDDP